MDMSANAFKVMGGIGIPTVAVSCYWLFTRLVWAGDYERDKQTALINKLEWRRDQLDNDLRRLNLMRQDLVNSSVQRNIKSDLQRQRSDINGHLDSIRGR